MGNLPFEMQNVLHSDESHRAARSALRIPSLFGTLPTELQEKLRAVAKRHKYQDGQILAQRGDEADGFWVVEKGQVKIGNYNDAGDMHALLIIRDGGSFGELACLGQFDRVVTAEALGPVEALWISERQFMRLIAGDPEASRTLVKTLAIQLQEAINGMIELRNVSAPKRLAARLIALSGGAVEAISLPIRQQELAELIGASRMTVASALAELERIGLIERRYRYIVLKDPVGLRRWAGF